MSEFIKNLQTNLNDLFTEKKEDESKKKDDGLFSKFKLMKEDENNYYVQHPNGKLLEVGKSQLHDKAHEMIKSLKPAEQEEQHFADGGEAAALDEYVAGNSLKGKNYLGIGSDPIRDYYTGTGDNKRIEDMNNLSNTFYSPADKSMFNMDYGSLGNPNYIPQTNQNIEPQPVTGEAYLRQIGLDPNSQEFKDRLAQHNELISQQKQPISNMMGFSAPTGQFNLAPSIVPDVSTMKYQPARIPDEVAKDIRPQTQSNLNEYSLESYLNKTKEIAEKQKALAMKMGNVKAGALSRQASDIQKTMAQYEALPSYQDVIKGYDETNQKLFNAYANQELDPSRVWSSMGAGDKAMAGIGLLLSGIGSGLTKQPNLAMQVIDKAIDRDIELQKAQAGKMHTLWEMNRSRMSTDIEASLATRNQMLNAIKYKTMAYAAQSDSALAIMEAQQRAMQFDLAMQQINGQLGMSAVLNGRAGTGTEQETQNAMAYAQSQHPELYKDAQSKYIGGVGMAKKPIPEADQTNIRDIAEIGKMMGHALEFAKKMQQVVPGAWTPKNRADAEFYRNFLEAKMNRVIDVARFSEGEGKLYKGILGDLGDFNLGGVPVKMQKLYNKVNEEMNSRMKFYQIKPFSDSSLNINGMKTQGQAPATKSVDITDMNKQFQGLPIDTIVRNPETGELFKNTAKGLVKVEGK